MVRMKWNIAAVVLTCTVLAMVTEVNSVRYIVGANMGWTSNVNYTIWAQGKHFYTEDWLYFVYDRNQNDIIEVNRTNYETCNAEHPIHNFTTGAGRDVVALNVSRNYYFISSKGSCYGGMKLAVHVEKTPPPPKAAPSKSGASVLSLRGKFVLPAVFAIASAWDSLLRLT